ncbi:hypothetical protein, partial [Acidianus sp. RZ1]
ILYYITKIRTYIGLFFSYFALLMMLTMFLGASIYLYSPSNVSLAVAFAVNMGVMITVLAYFFAIAENISERKLHVSSIHVYSISLLAVLNEVLMGSTFGLAQFGSRLFSTPYNAFYYSINSYWFFLPMMSEMIGFYVIHYLRGLQYPYLLPLVGVTAFPPTAFNVSNWFPFAVIMTLGISAYGVFFSKRRDWKYVYLSLIVTGVILIINALPYDLNVVIAMTLYYSSIFFQVFQRGEIDKRL